MKNLFLVCAVPLFLIPADISSATQKAELALTIGLLLTAETACGVTIDNFKPAPSLLIAEKNHAPATNESTRKKFTLHPKPVFAQKRSGKQTIVSQPMRSTSYRSPKAHHTCKAKIQPKM